jgi:hypothetical protein
MEPKKKRRMRIGMLAKTVMHAGFNPPDVIV